MSETSGTIFAPMPEFREPSESAHELPGFDTQLELGTTALKPHDWTEQRSDELGGAMKDTEPSGDPSDPRFEGQDESESGNPRRPAHTLPPPEEDEKDKE